MVFFAKKIELSKKELKIQKELESRKIYHRDGSNFPMGHFNKSEIQFIKSFKTRNKGKRYLQKHMHPSRIFMTSECSCKNGHSDDCQYLNSEYRNLMLGRYEKRSFLFHGAFRTLADWFLSNVKNSQRMIQGELFDMMDRNPIWIVCQQPEFEADLPWHGDDIYHKYLLIKQYMKLPRTDSSLIAEADDEEEDFDQEQAAGGMMAYLNNLITGKAKDSVEWTIDVIKDYVAKLFSFFSSSMGSVFKTLGSYVQNLKDRIVTAIINVLGLTEFAAAWNMVANRSCLLKGILILVLIIMTVGSLIGFTLSRYFFAMIFRTYKIDVQIPNPKDLVAQAPSTVVSFVMSILTAICSVPGKVLTGVEKVLSHVEHLVRGGNACITLFPLLLILLPIGLREAVTNSTMTEQKKNDLKVQDWCDRAIAMIRISKTSRVLTSELYRKEISTLQTQAREFQRSTMTQAVRSRFSQTYPGILKISILIAAFENSVRERPPPYSLHISSPPGYGKSAIVKRLIRDLGGYDQEYAVPIGSEFWDGVSDPDVVIWDEFLINGDRATEDATQYLGLVSSGVFQPPLASVDDANVGIKGTTITPKLVVTLNNTIHNRVPHIDNTALQRRRDLVIELVLKPAYRRLVSRGVYQVDMGRLPSDVIRNISWLDFRLYRPIYSMDNYQEDAQSQTIDYQELIRVLKQRRDEFQETSDVIQEELGQETDYRDPRIIIEDAIKEISGIPTKPVTLSDWIGDQVLGMTMAAQAPEDSVYKEMCDKTNYYDAAKPYVGRLGLIIKVLIGVLLLTYFISNLLSEPENRVEQVLFSESPTSNKQKGVKKIPGKRIIRGWKQIRAQASEDSSYCELLFGTKCYRTTSLGEGWFVTYAHGIMAEQSDSSEAVLIHQGNRYEIDFNDCVVNYLEGRDLFFFYISDPKKRPQTKKIIGRFVYDSDIANINRLCLCTENSKGKIFGNAQRRENRSYVYQNQRLEVVDGWLMFGDSQSGDCGSWYQVTAGPLEGKIVGMHIAGSCNKSSNSIVMATVLTRDIIEEGMGLSNSEPTEPEGEMRAEVEEPIHSQSDPILDVAGPNLEYIQLAPSDEYVHLPTKTAYKSSVLADHLINVEGFPCEKQPSVLHPSDPRCDGDSPIEIHLADMASVEHPHIDEEIIEQVFATMEENFDRDIFWIAGKGPCTIEEAIGGIPGKLQGLKTMTSPGYPRVLHKRKRKGKMDCFWYDESGKLHIAEDFRQEVMEMYERVLKGDGTGHVWLGYPKDELRSFEKIKKSMTRFIYASSAVGTVVFRMFFGRLMAALNASFGSLSSAVGMNQYSYDMEAIFAYLTEVGKPNRTVAGDYKGFDKRHHPQVRTRAYKMLEFLAKKHLNIEDSVFRAFFYHECCSPCQIGKYRFKPKSMHMSGCFWTAWLNNLVNEAYIRIAFKWEFPYRNFDECVRLKVLGDDNVYMTSEEVHFDGRVLSKHLEKLGQCYTSDSKDSDPGPYRNFEEITFLGAHPRIVNGLWAGALNKSTLLNIPLWTRDGDESIEQVVKTCCDMASLWEKEWYEDYKASLVRACESVEIEFPRVPAWSDLRTVVANRTAANGCVDWFRGESEELVAEAPPIIDNVEMTQFQVTESTSESYGALMDRSRLAVNEQPCGLNYGLDSYVFRDSYNWTAATAVGNEVFNIYFPYIIDTKNPKHVQDIPFSMFMYTHFDMSVKIQITAPPTVQGIGVFYARPNDGSRPHTVNLKATQPHKLMSPDENPTCELTMPFRFPKNVLNTFAFRETNYLMASFHFAVISQLTSTVSTDFATISVYTKFPNAKFAIPRPFGLASDTIPDDEMMIAEAPPDEPEEQDDMPDLEWNVGDVEFGEWTNDDDGYHSGEGEYEEAPVAVEPPQYPQVDINIMPEELQPILNHMRHVLHDLHLPQGQADGFLVPVILGFRAQDPDDGYFEADEFVEEDNYIMEGHPGFWVERRIERRVRPSIPEPENMRATYTTIINGRVTDFQHSTSPWYGRIEMNVSYNNNVYLDTVRCERDVGELHIVTNIHQENQIENVLLDVRGFDPLDAELQAEGNTSAKTTNTYNIHDVAGTVPIQTGTDSSGHRVSTDAQVDIVPMDNPPLASGGIPMVPQFPGQSTTFGIQPTSTMQVHPCAMYREPGNLFDDEEMTIRFLCSQQGEIARFKVKVADTEGKIYLTFPMTSMLGTQTSSYVPVPLVFLNMFMFAAFDIDLEFVVARNKFQTFRLRATTAYGAPSLTADGFSRFKNEILDFSGDNKIARLRIPYNAETEFIKTYSGSIKNPIQDSSLGIFGVSLANQMRCSSKDIVAQECEVIVYASFHNVKVAVPRPFSLIRTIDMQPWNIANPLGEEEELVAEAGDDIEATEGISDEPAAVEMTKSEIPNRDMGPHNLVLGAKFEHLTHNITDIMRRFRPLTLTHMRTETCTTTEYVGQTPKYMSWTNYSFDVGGDLLPLSDFFIAGGGTLRFRLFWGYEDNSIGKCLPEVYFLPVHGPTENQEEVKMARASINAQSHQECKSLMKVPGNKKEISMYTNNPGAEVKADNPSDWGVPAMEISFQYNSEQCYLDFSVPFDTHFLYVINKQHKNHINALTGTTWGRVVIRSPTADALYFVSSRRLLVCAGDDFRFGLYAPPAWNRTFKFFKLSDGRTEEQDTQISLPGYYYKKTPT